MEPKNFSIKEALGFGWRKTKENLGFFIKIFFIYLATSLILGVFLSLIDKDSDILQIIVGFWQIFLSLGLIKIFLNFYDGVENKLSFLFSQKKAFLKFLLATFLIGIIAAVFTILGLVLFYAMNNLVGKILFLILIISLTVYFPLRLKFFPYFIVDKNSGPVESLKNSWNLTKGIVLKIFLLELIRGLINILGLLFFIVGLFITIPVSGLAMVFVYRKLLEQHELSLNTLHNNQ